MPDYSTVGCLEAVHLLFLLLSRASAGTSFTQSQHQLFCTPAGTGAHVCCFVYYTRGCCCCCCCCVPCMARSNLLVHGPCCCKAWPHRAACDELEVVVLQPMQHTEQVASARQTMSMPAGHRCEPYQHHHTRVQHCRHQQRRHVYSGSFCRGCSVVIGASHHPALVVGCAHGCTLTLDMPYTHRLPVALTSSPFTFLMPNTLRYMPAMLVEM